MSKVLVGIFEDDAVSRYIYERTFANRSDISLFVFDRVETGIDTLQQLPFDIVLIEAHFMGNFGGIEILKKIQATMDKVPTCIAMTSLLQKGDLERLMGAGFTMCIEKPVILSDLLPEP